MSFDSPSHLQTHINAQRFEGKRGKKRDIFGNTEKKSLLWIGRLTNSTIVLEFRSSRFPFGFFRVSPPFSPLSSLTSSLRFSHRLVRISVFVFTATTGGWQGGVRRATTVRIMCARVCVHRVGTKRHVALCACVCEHHLARATRRARALALSFSRVHAWHPVYVRGSEGHSSTFLSRPKRVCDGDSDVNSRLQARAAHAWLASRWDGRANGRAARLYACVHPCPPPPPCAPNENDPRGVTVSSRRARFRERLPFVEENPKLYRACCAWSYHEQHARYTCVLYKI